MHRTLLAAPLLAALLAGPAMAGDDDDDDRRCGAGVGEWMSVAAIAAKAEAAGYVVREVERDDGCYEINGRDRDGRRVEIDLNPRTGEIVRVDNDRDDDDDDDD